MAVDELASRLRLSQIRRNAAHTILCLVDPSSVSPGAASEPARGYSASMPTIKLWRTGKRRRTTYRLTVEEARARYVDPEPVPNSCKVLSQCDDDVSR